jgi:protein TonB
MISEIEGGLGMDEFDVLLNDVLRTVANPELPGRVMGQVGTRVWLMREPMSQSRDPSTGSGQAMGHPTPVAFAPEVFLARMSLKRDARTSAAAVLLHVAAIGLLFWAVSLKTGLMLPVETVDLMQLTAPPPMLPAKSVMGGGGGQHGATPAVQGHLPKFAEMQITPPKAPLLEQPKIAMPPEATVEVEKDLKMADSALPNIGMPNSPVVGTSSMGNGSGSGLGSGYGGGIGPGVGWNYGGGLAKVGGGVSSPVLIHEVEPEFSEEARKAKFQGNVMVSLVVDPQGMPRNVRVTRGAGMGLDEKAMEAVRQYRFRPAMENGKGVAVEMNVEVEFQIF